MCLIFFMCKRIEGGGMNNKIYNINKNTNIVDPILELSLQTPEYKNSN